MEGALSASTAACDTPLRHSPVFVVRTGVLQQHRQLLLLSAVASDVKTERSEPTSQSLLSLLLRRASPISATIDPATVGLACTNARGIARKLA